MMARTALAFPFVLGIFLAPSPVRAEKSDAAPPASDGAAASAPASPAEARPSPAATEPTEPTASAAPAAPAIVPAAKARASKPEPAPQDSRPFIVVCQDGECLPYTRGCPRGLRFDGRDCVPVVPPTPVEQAAADREAEQKHTMRMLERRRPRLTISLEGVLGIRSGGVHALAAGLHLGYQGQVTPHFGLILRGGVLGGTALYGTTGDNDPALGTTSTSSTSLFGLMLQLMPYFGPFGRLYLGPLGCLGYFSHGRNSLGWGMDTVSLRDGLAGGAGLMGGVLIGERERVAVQFMVMAGALRGDPLFLTTVGLVFRY
jgi:hypothetical protein